MPVVKTALGDVAKALVVLAMCLFLLGGAPPDSSGSGTVAQQAGALGSLFTSLCGGHDQAPVACHAPNTCCRPDHMLLPPRQPSIASAFGRADAVAYSMPPSSAAQAVAPSLFRARAPPSV